jgi:HEAT repeat protein
MSKVHALVGDLLSDDEARAEAAVAALARLGEPALDALLPLCESPEVDTRWWAVRAAAAHPDDRASRVLTTALEDEAPEVRQAAALGLRLHPSSDALPGLVRLLGEVDPLGARLASDALAALGGEALPALRTAAVDPLLRPNAVRAMALMRAPAAIPDLFAALDDDSLLTRHWAERGLEDLGVGMVFFRAD